MAPHKLRAEYLGAMYHAWSMGSDGDQTVKMPYGERSLGWILSRLMVLDSIDKRLADRDLNGTWSGVDWRTSSWPLITCYS